MTESNGHYANPDALVSTQWASEHAGDQGVRLIEVDVDTTAYDDGHLEGAVGWNWRRDLQDQTVRDLAPKGALEALLGKSGVAPDTTVVLYGDNNNWFAAWGYWIFATYGHANVKLMDGGRAAHEEERR